MSTDAFPGAGPPPRPKDLRLAEEWLSCHGLPGVRPTPLLAARLAVRRRARLADQVLLAGLFIGAALIHTYNRLSTSAFGGFQPPASTPLLMLIGLVAVMLLVQVLLDQWVRRVDRRAGAALPRRTAHLARPGWRALLGRPRAAFTVVMFGGATLLALSALAVQDATVRQAALIVLIGVAGAAAGVARQLRDLLVRPIVAEDEASLTADVIMRVEDAREVTMPSVPWSLPVVLLFGTAPLWWNVASIAFVLLGLAMLVAITKRTPPSVTVARRVMSFR
ncbi:hypothetical protein [Nonomuraea sp. NPDC048826]|uniref:hypothetical protein n=1 Tax=Nonomuraea sp. NPDC048826 TaxID=3364347 RepID=UPI003712D1F8